MATSAMESLASGPRQGLFVLYLQIFSLYGHNNKNANFVEEEIEYSSYLFSKLLLGISTKCFSDDVAVNKIDTCYSFLKKIKWSF